jgi:glycosyl transferase family 87
MLPLLWSAKSDIVAGKTDFSDLYAAAVVVKEGQGRLLYNDDAQTEVKSRLFPNGRTTRTHNHLAFEALCLVPLAFLPYPAALIIWIGLNLALLAFTMHRLERRFPRLRASLGVPLLVPCLGFYPIGQTIFEGQDSIVILVLYSAAFLCLGSNKPLLGGVALALALFKFHLVLPTILLLLMYRERKAVLAFFSTAFALVGLSALVVGFSGMLQFANNLIASNSELTDPTNRARFALNPTAYSNVRGLVYWAAGQHTSDSMLLMIVVATSLILLVAAGLLYHRVPPDLRFPFSIVVTTLVSFHLYYHDVSMMLIPMFVAAEAALAGRCNRAVLTVIFAVLMLAPLYPLSYLYNLASLMSIPIAAVGVCLASGLQSSAIIGTSPPTVEGQHECVQ